MVLIGTVLVELEREVSGLNGAVLVKPESEAGLFRPTMEELKRGEGLVEAGLADCFQPRERSVGLFQLR